MTSRERIQAAIRHQSSDKVPVDLGGTSVTGIAASTYAKLRRALGLPMMPVKVVDPYQMLAEVEPEVRELLGIDTVPVFGPSTMFGFRNENWKPWQLFDGTEVLVPGQFNVTVDTNGDLLMHPQGDTSLPPSARMPRKGYYFDAIIRQEPIDEDHLDPDEWLDGYTSVHTDEEVAFVSQQINHLCVNTELAVVYWSGCGGLGDIAKVPSPGMKHPKGIRDVELWYTAPLLYPDYIHGIFERQTDIAIQNLQRIYKAVGNTIDVLGVSGTDFGMQTGPFINPNTYRDFYKPCHMRINDWVHQNTSWKTLFHTCGSVVAYLDDFVEAGVDILNPVQCSAKGMDPETLKQRWGDQLVFWGGIVDTQHTLPFGTPDEVQAQVSERIKILGKDGGLVAAAIHNIQPNTPVENILAMFEALRS